MEQLRRWREARGLSQTKLAARADLNPATVNQIERGRREASPTTLHKLADALDVSLYQLLEGEPNPKAQSPLPLNSEAGSELLQRALDAARQDDEKDAHAIARLGASQGVPQSVSGYAEDEFRAELRELGFPDEYFEGFLWPLVQKAHMAEQMETLIGIAFPGDDYRTAVDRAFKKSLEDARS